ncbi:hypothetical protein ACVIGA_008989 [Bradyrhizobium sp. USDA 3240]
MTRDITPAGWPATGAVDEAFAEVRASFDRFCLAAGIEALGTMMEADVVAGRATIARRRGGRTLGRTRGRIGFHGGKIEVSARGSGAWMAARSRSRAGKRRRRRIGSVAGR